MRQRVLIDTGIVFLCAAVVLLMTGRTTQPGRLHVGALNDQVGYVSVARNLLDRGELTSSIIYTSTLRQDAARNYLYMPGHYLCLAAMFAVAGPGPWQAIAPSALSYCLAAVCVFLTARRLRTRGAGFIAAAVFMSLPAGVFYALTAMSELTLIFAASLAFCIFAHLPGRFRVLAGPALAALPFFFRETASLLVIPMAGLALGGIPMLERIERKQWLTTGALCGLSVVLLAGVLVLPPSSGRPSLAKAALFAAPGLDFYHDATIWDRLPTGARAWVDAIRANCVRNVRSLASIPHSQPRGLEVVSMAAIVAGIGLAMVVGCWRRHALTLFTGVMGGAVLVLLFALYSASGHRGLRTLLFVWPMLAVVAGVCLVPVIQAGGLVPSRRRSIVAVVLVVFAVGLMTVSASIAANALRFIAAADAADDEALAFVESSGHDPGRLLASPYWLGLPYAAAHHPAQWAFLPANAPTLSALMEKYDVGTLLVPAGSTLLDEDQIRSAGFDLVRTAEWKGQRIAIYRNRRPGDGIPMG